MSDQPPPETDADERTTLLAFLDYLRDGIAANAAGLPDDQVRAAGVPSGTSLLGLVRHLTCVERFCFLGEDRRDWQASWRVGADETADDVIAAYRSTVREANDAVAGWTDLDEPGPRPARGGHRRSRRWLLVHMIEETGRHAGHGDIIRELADGTTGR